MAIKGARCKLILKHLNGEPRGLKYIDGIEILTFVGYDTAVDNGADNEHPENQYGQDSHPDCDPDTLCANAIQIIRDQSTKPIARERVSSP